MQAIAPACRALPDLRLVLPQAQGLSRALAHLRQRLLRLRINDARLPREGIILLGEQVPAVNDRLHELLPQHRHKLVVPIPLQRQDGPLIGQPLALPGPVVLRRIAEGRVIRSHRGQGQLCPELLRIQQMLLYKAVRHLLGNAPPVHAAQRVVTQHVHLVPVLVPVKESAAFCIPQLLPQHTGDSLCLFAPLPFPAVTADAADLAKGVPAGIGEGRHVHGRHRHHVAIPWRLFAEGIVGRCAVADGIVLAGVILAPGFQQPVPVGIPHPPQVGVEALQAICQPVEVIPILAQPIVHIERRPRKAKPLEFVELRLHRAVRESLDGACNPSVRPLMAHKEQMVVQRSLQVVGRIHLAAHRLGFKPDFLVSAALDEDDILPEAVQVAPALANSLVIQPLEGCVGTAERHMGMGEHDSTSGQFFLPVLYGIRADLASKKAAPTMGQPLNIQFTLLAFCSSRDTAEPLAR